MTLPSPTHPGSQGGGPPASPRVAEFLLAFDAGPGAAIAARANGSGELTASLTRLQVGHDPFTHGTIDGFLPDSLYAAVLRDWPADSELSAVPLPGTDTPSGGYVGTHTTRLLQEWHADELPMAWSATGEQARTSQTWDRVSAALRSPAFVRGVFTRFAKTIEANLATLGDTAAGQPGFRLYLSLDQGPEEALGAHVDALRKLLTIVVYLDLAGAVDNDSEQLWGTALYDTAAGAVRPVEFSANSAHRLAHRIGFTANRAFLMPNDSRALHGVAGGQAGVVRRTLMCGYWLFDQP